MAGVSIETLKLIRDISNELIELRLDELNLLLFGNNLPEFSTAEWNGDYEWQPSEDERRVMLQRVVRKLDEPDLRQLARGAQELFDRAEITAIEGEPARLNVFASHLSPQRALLHEVRDYLQIFSIDFFVAHDDIKIDAAWHDAIEEGLSIAHAGVVFLHPKFIESEWCAQEVGWLLGRGIPLRTLRFNYEVPFGPFGKRQAQEIPPGTTGLAIASSLLEWLAGQRQLQAHYATSLAEALLGAPAFRFTDQIWNRLSKLDGLTAGQVATVANAVRDNDQVYRANSQYAPAILDFLEQQPGAAASAMQIAEARRARGLVADGQPF